jgi:hypothetical protein
MKSQKALESLFVSKVRIKLLRYLFTHQGEPIHLRGAMREINEEINAVRREFSRMEEIGLVKPEVKGNRKYYALDQDFVFFGEVLGMIFKSTGLGNEILTHRKKLGSIHFAVITQGLTRGEQLGKHKMDLVIIGDGVELDAVADIVTKEEKRLSREIHYAVIELRDFNMRKARNDLFVQELLTQELVMLIGDRIELARGLH